ncbi:MAG: DegT/DnrJ/EryC1/StrS family aminotransferase [Lysobacterales bacterium]
MFDSLRVQSPHLASMRDAIDAVLASGRLVLGPAVADFEQAFADYIGVNHCIGVANGSDALELALRALEIGPGSTVLTVANAGGYASTAIRACGAQARYVEIDDQTLLIDGEALELALAERPRALVLTHLYGQMADAELISALCRQHGVALIEDCAQAHGAERNGRRAGSYGALSCFSFYPTKNLGAVGDGGAVLTADVQLAHRVRQLRQYGWSDKYRVDLAGGRNSRLDELQAAVLGVKLLHLEAENERRRAVARRYQAQVRNPLIRLPARAAGPEDVVHLAVLRCSRRDALRAHLAEYGIDSDVHYPIPDHWQPAWRDASPPSLPVTEAAAAEVLSLPCHPALDEEEIERVIEAVNAFR